MCSIPTCRLTLYECEPIVFGRLADGRSALIALLGDCFPVLLGGSRPLIVINPERT